MNRQPLRETPMNGTHYKHQQRNCSRGLIMQPVNERKRRILPLLAAISLFIPSYAQAVFDSGSTETHGAFTPSVNTQLTLPADGIFNFTNVHIPSDITVTFKKNTANTPVVIRASGDVIIEGEINISGGSSSAVGTAGDGNIGDDGQPGSGGPGAGDGGRGGSTGSGASARGGNGLGPGAGGGGVLTTSFPVGGGGGGFSAQGQTNLAWVVSSGYRANIGNYDNGGVIYGTDSLLPLLGGSGGGGGAGDVNYGGSGGGGGGGAILIASSGTVNVTGSILAKGGNSGQVSGSSSGSSGGGGSGGAIRIIATTISGNGTISATAGSVGSVTASGFSGGTGAAGRIRLEAESVTRSSATSPAYSFSGTPGAVFLTGLPTLKIDSIASVSVPIAPTGVADVILPANTANPVTITFTTLGVPDDSNVQLTVTPAIGEIVTQNATVTANAASMSVSLPSGPSTLTAITTYTVIASLGDALSTYAMGERVKKVRLSTSLNGPSMLTLISVSGKEYTMPSQVAAGILGS